MLCNSATTGLFFLGIVVFLAVPARDQVQAADRPRPLARLCQAVATPCHTYCYDTNWISSFRASASRLQARIDSADSDGPDPASEAVGGSAGPHGIWKKSQVDPAGIVKLCPHLALRTGWALHAYLFRAGGNGNGYVVAVRKGRGIPSIAEVEELPGMPWSKNWEDLANVFHRMVAIRGDGSSVSYLEASILDRELKAFGAQWHGIDWGTHTVLDSLPTPRGDAEGDTPFDPLSDVSTRPSQWKWKSGKPMQWKPSVRNDGDCVVVTFHTYSGLITDEGGDKIVRHVDTYLKGHYSPIKSVHTTLAVGEGGFCF